MKYENIVSGTFRKRPNRFIAHVVIDGTEEICHVKNTGRCRELLVPGCTVYCAVSDNPKRKTKFDLVAVEKKTENRSLLINMDSQAPNAAVKEWLASGQSPFGKPDLIKPECRYGNSRFDFYLEINDFNTPVEDKSYHNVHRTVSSNPAIRKIFLEVKGVTLEENGIVLFPDAPTERGVKHVRELIECHKEGYETCILFVVQMNKASYFTPNRKTHPQFADILNEAQNSGVQLMACTCCISPDEIAVDKPLDIRLKD
ncbi:MAG: DNA/RNA nuclease SfsA [Acidaminococcaceae bacterium]|nr:DNA/RNA nuclease SfsA [Acidaminococcaceae bacterium]